TASNGCAPATASTSCPARISRPRSPSTSLSLVSAAMTPSSPFAFMGTSSAFVARMRSSCRLINVAVTINPINPSTCARGSLQPAGPRYRGRPACALAWQDVRFESVAELLWTGEWIDRVGWGGTVAPLSPYARVLPAGTHPLTLLAAVVPLYALRDPTRFAGDL